MAERERKEAAGEECRRTFATAHYRGVKKNDNVYSGFLACGDCGTPMFAMSRSDLKDTPTAAAPTTAGV